MSKRTLTVGFAVAILCVVVWQLVEHVNRHRAPSLDALVGSAVQQYRIERGVTPEALTMVQPYLERLYAKATFIVRDIGDSRFEVEMLSPRRQCALYERRYRADISEYEYVYAPR